MLPNWLLWLRFLQSIFWDINYWFFAVEVARRLNHFFAVVSVTVSWVAGQYHYLSLVVDVFSRMIVHWEIHERESSEKAAAMLSKLSAKKYVQGLTLHVPLTNPSRADTETHGQW